MTWVPPKFYSIYFQIHPTCWTKCKRGSLKWPMMQCCHGHPCAIQFNGVLGIAQVSQQRWENWGLRWFICLLYTFFVVGTTRIHQTLDVLQKGHCFTHIVLRLQWSLGIHSGVMVYHGSSAGPAAGQSTVYSLRLMLSVQNSQMTCQVTLLWVIDAITSLCALIAMTFWCSHYHQHLWWFFHRFHNGNLAYMNHLKPSCIHKKLVLPSPKNNTLFFETQKIHLLQIEELVDFFYSLSLTRTLPDDLFEVRKADFQILRGYAK